VIVDGPCDDKEEEEDGVLDRSLCCPPRLEAGGCQR